MVREVFARKPYDSDVVGAKDQPLVNSVIASERAAVKEL